MFFDADQWPGGKNLATTPAIWRRMFDAIPSPNFGLNFDPSHFIWQQVDYVKPLAEFKDRIFHVHAKDARIEQTALERAWAPGLSQTLAHAQDSRNGRRPLGSFLRRLERRGLSGHVAIEVEDRAFEGSVELRQDSLRISRRFLLQYLAG